MSALIYRRDRLDTTNAALAGGTAIFIPAAARQVVCYRAGAQCNGATGSTSLTVYPGHAFPFAGGGKLALMRYSGGAWVYVTGSVRTVASATQTTVVISGSNLNVQDGDYLVNIGADSGVSDPVWDASPVFIWQNAGGNGTRVSSPFSTLTPNSQGEYFYWRKEANCWEIVHTGPSTTPVGLRFCQEEGDRQVFNVLDFGAKADGATDDSAAFQAAINSAGANATLRIPAGNYLLTAGVTISNHKLVVKGDGRGATVITFTPGSSATLFTVNLGGGQILYHPTFRDFTLVGGGANAKVAFKFIDCSEMIVDSVSATGWSGAGASEFIQFQGREHARILNCHASECDTVIHIKDDPNGTVDCDHFNFHDCVFGCFSATSGSIILVDSGVNLSNLSFTGAHSWNAGQFGFNFVDTTANAPIALMFQNVRWEQSGSATGYMFNISVLNSMRGLVIDNCYCSGNTNANGLKFRNVTYACVRDFQFVGAVGKVCFDIDATCSNIYLENIYNFASVPPTKNGTETFTAATSIRVDANTVQAGASSDGVVFQNGNFGVKVTATQLLVGDLSNGSFNTELVVNFSSNEVQFYQTALRTLSASEFISGVNTENVAITGATNDSVAQLCPANSIIECVTTRVTTAISGGGVTSINIGDDSPQATRFGSVQPITGGSTSVLMAFWDSTGVTGPVNATARKVRISSVGGTPTTGSVRVTVYYRQGVPPTS